MQRFANILIVNMMNLVQYRRSDAIGTPFAITIDDNTIENDTVTLRDRDTMEQITLKVDELIPFISKKIEL